MKNKTFKKIMAALLAVSMLFVSACGSCGGKPEDPTAKTGRGTHVYNNTETNAYIVKDGKCDYEILIPENASETLKNAAQELNLFFKEATEISLSIVTETKENGKYLSIGETELYKTSGLSADKTLGTDGYKITTKGSNVFMYGYKDKGALYAVYGLLNDLFGFEAYYVDTYGVEKNVTEKKLVNYDVTEIPDFAVRANGFEIQTANPQWEQRMKIDEMWDMFEDLSVKNGVGKTHNSMLILDQDLYNDSKVEGQKYKLKNFNDDTEYEMYHPEWYWKAYYNYKGNQLCFTAHGDDASWELMMKTVADQMIEAIKNTQRPAGEVIRMQFSISDNSGKCGCDACNAAVEEYGTYTGLNIKACNKLSDLVQAWMESDAGKPYARDFEIYFLAYEQMQYVPVKTVNGEKVVTIKCKENVVPIIAPAHMDFTASINAEINKTDKADMSEWKNVASTMFLWSYSTNFYHYFIMYDNFGEMQEYYQFCYDIGISEIREQSQTGQYGGASGFQNLKAWLQSKLQWNVELDFNELLDDYFDAYFGPASEKMRQVFDETRTHIAKQKAREDKPFGGRDSMFLTTANDPDYWSIPLLEYWRDLCEEAIDTLEPLKMTDSAQYQTYYDHIVMERISYVYMLATIFEDDLGDAKLAEARSTVLTDVSRLGIPLASWYTTFLDATAGWED